MLFEQLNFCLRARKQGGAVWRRAVRYTRYRAAASLRNRQRLRLGFVMFELTPIIFEGWVLGERMEMRYIRQDTTDEDEHTVEALMAHFAIQFTRQGIFILSSIFLLLGWRVWRLLLPHITKLSAATFPPATEIEILFRYAADSSYGLFFSSLIDGLIYFGFLL